MFARRSVVAVLMLVTAVRPGSAAPPKSDDLPSALHRLAGELHTLLADQHAARVWVEPLVPASSRLDGNLSGALTEMLADELRLQQVVLDRDAPIRIRGKYRCKLNADDRLATRIDLEVWRQQKIGDLSTELVSLETANWLSGKSQCVPTQLTGAQREQIVKAAVLDDLPAGDVTVPALPALSVDGTLLRFGGDEPYAVQILARPADHGTYQPLIPTVRDGQSFVDIGRDQVYAIRVVNKSKYDAAVQVFIDGLSVFQFSDRKDDCQHFIVPQGKAGAVMGWHRSTQATQLFHVKGLTESAAREVDPKETGNQVGLIQVRFARAWPKGSPVPPEERGIRPQRGQSLATARGTEIEKQQTEVERHIGEFHAFFAIRYSK